ncbi:unnamed protein product [Prunus brigantina]
MLLLLVFFLGGIDEDNGLIPSRVANLCRGFFPPAANGLGCCKGKTNMSLALRERGDLGAQHLFFPQLGSGSFHSWFAVFLLSFPPF